MKSSRHKYKDWKTQFNRATEQTFASNHDEAKIITFIVQPYTIENMDKI